jgi:hypothetical protein
MAETGKLAAMSSAGAVSGRLYFTERDMSTSRWCVRVLSELETSIRHTSASEPEGVRHLKGVDALKE